MALPVSAADVHEATAQMRAVARYTPMEPARWLAEMVGGPVTLKCENLQRTGSFKIRGAYTRISRLTEQERARGIVAASAGNHAQGVALAASVLGCRATVFMPHGASLVKERATRGYGADVVLTGSTVDEAVLAATELAERTGAVFVHPFDHADVVAGQGSVGVEIAEQQPDVATVVVCLGGGGLLAGVATVLNGDPSRDHVRVVGVQAKGAAAFPPSLLAGHPVLLESMSTMADGIAVGLPGTVPFAQIREYVDEIVTVDEDEIARALVRLLERDKLLAEPSGAVAVAAVMANPEAFRPPVVATVSGGNVDPLLLSRLMRHGLVADGRYLSFGVVVPDRPGSLAALLAALASTGANVLDVVHERTRSTLELDEVEVWVVAETRGPDHRDEVLAAVRSADTRWRLRVGP